MPAGRLLGRPTLRWLVRFLVSVGIVVYILVDVDSGDLMRGLFGVRVGLVAVALALYLGGQAISAYKWYLLGRSVGFARPLADYVLCVWTPSPDPGLHWLQRRLQSGLQVVSGAGER